MDGKAKARSIGKKDANRNGIPAKILKSLGLEPGQKMHVMLYVDRIELIPVQDIRETRGFLEGIDTSIEREVD